MQTANVLLAASVIATGLMAGLFYGWVVSVIPGTTQLDDGDYVTTMQHINREILTPQFLVPFMGIPVLLGATAFAQWLADDERRAVLVGAAAVVYLVGVFGVTAARNVPLNDALGAFDLPAATPSGLAERRASYEGPWNRWNAIRTAANLAAFILVAIAAVVAEQGGT